MSKSESAQTLHRHDKQNKNKKGERPEGPAAVSVEADLPRAFSNVLAAMTPCIGANAILQTAPCFLKKRLPAGSRRQEPSASSSNRPSKKKKKYGSRKKKETCSVCTRGNLPCVRTDHYTCRHLFDVLNTSDQSRRSRGTVSASKERQIRHHNRMGHSGTSKRLSRSELLVCIGGHH